MTTKEFPRFRSARRGGPFVRDFLFEIARRIPARAGSALPASAGQPRGRSGLLRSGPGPPGLARRQPGDAPAAAIDELDSLFRSLLEALQQIDGRIHSAVSTRPAGSSRKNGPLPRRAGGARDLAQSLQDGGPHAPAAEMIPRVMERLEANARPSAPRPWPCRSIRHGGEGPEPPARADRPGRQGGPGAPESEPCATG